MAFCALRWKTPMAEPLFLGIDGGGSKTLAVIVDAAGRECGRGVAGSSNHEVVGLEAAVAAIHLAAERAAHAAKAALPVASACLGLAGVDHPGDIERLSPRVASLARAVRISNDAELALSALPGQVGVALIAGTGSIALGRDTLGHTARVGGWGHIFGDEGSGYAIGRAGLQAAARASDGRGSTTTLLQGILSAWELGAPELLLARVYQPFDKTAIAALAPLVLTLATAGDQAARRIEADAARELALAVTTVARTLNFPLGALPLVFAGGVLVHNEGLRALVVDGVAWTVTPVVVAEPAQSAARALCAMNHEDTDGDS
jgi:N-acetylglucosamine kinase-like BadF-type ATPase